MVVDCTLDLRRNSSFFVKITAHPSIMSAQPSILSSVEGCGRFPRCFGSSEITRCLSSLHNTAAEAAGQSCPPIVSSCAAIDWNSDTIYNMTVIPGSSNGRTTAFGAVDRGSNPRPGATRFAGAVLAGGAASRYGGIAKGLLEVSPGLSIIERTIREIQASGVSDVAVIANDVAMYERFGYPVVRDVTPGTGPLGGIESALAHYDGRCDAVLLLPCDLPAITSREISALLDGFRRCDSGVVYARVGALLRQPLCAVLHNGLRQEVTSALNRDKRRVVDLWREMGAVAVEFADPAPFFNVNTPGDLERWMKGGKPAQ